MKARSGVLAVLAVMLVPGSAFPEVPRHLEGPQVKVDRVQARDPGGWRAFLSAIDADGNPVSLVETGVRLFLSRGGGSPTSGGKPDWSFRPGGFPEPGFRGRLRTIAEAAVEQAAIFVVAAHAEVPREVSAQAADLVQRLAKGLRKDARTGLLVYQDHLWIGRGGPGGPWMGDLNDRQGCLDALQGTADAFSSPPQEGECGALFPGSESWKTLPFPAPQGMFPRFLGIPEDGEVLRAAQAQGQNPLDRRGEEAAGAPFAEGAVEAALRWLAIAAPATAQRLVLVLSDGRDGYLRVADLAADRHSRRCQPRVEACRSRKGEATYDLEGASPRCSRGVMECAIPKVADGLRSREERVLDRLAALVNLARALEVQVHVLALPGTDAVGRSRLKALAWRTGGGYFEAADLPGLEDATSRLAASLSRQSVLEPRKSLEEGASYRLMASWEGVESGWFPVVAGPGEPFWKGPWSRVRKAVLGRLGHAWGPPVLWASLVAAIAMVLLILWTMGKGAKALVARIGRPRKPPRPAAPKMPVLKRPGG
ncbi:hypothetical protein KBD49_15580 [Myxococcota bacterium]|nr:hypothetical protein [Myxococcota bacterium]